MSEQSSTIASKVWGMRNSLRDDGVSYGDYMDQFENFRELQSQLGKQL